MTAKKLNERKSRRLAMQRVLDPPVAWIAHHEAAHAVADLRGGFAPYAVSIARRATTLGQVVSVEGWADRETAERQLVSLYAGQAAQSLFFPESEGPARVAAAEDFELARQVLDVLYGEATPDREQEWQSQAIAFVDHEREVIAAVARELEQRRFLDGDELERIVAAADARRAKEEP